MKGVRYAVFGCGNHDWVATYQRIPTLIDNLAAERGAERLVERGVGDAGGSDFFDSFDKWEAGLWKVLGEVSCSSITSFKAFFAYKICRFIIPKLTRRSKEG